MDYRTTRNFKLATCYRVSKEGQEEKGEGGLIASFVLHCVIIHVLIRDPFLLTDRAQ